MSEHIFRHCQPSVTSYKRGCRCPDCTEAQRIKHAADRARLASLPRDRVPHGSWGGYSNWGCRCEECSRVNSAQCKQYRAEKVERAGAQG